MDAVSIPLLFVVKQSVNNSQMMELRKRASGKTLWRTKTRATTWRIAFTFYALLSPYLLLWNPPGQCCRSSYLTSLGGTGTSEKLSFFISQLRTSLGRLRESQLDNQNADLMSLI